MIYLTYNDQPSGIYSGQVIDVCKFVRDDLKVSIRLLAFTSLRGFWKSRSKIKTELPDAIVLPMIPKSKNWRLNSSFLFIALWLLRDKKCIARGPFATALALNAKRKKILDIVVFDARGAYTAELNEYDVVPDERVKVQIRSLEHQAIHKSQKQLAVSNALVNYWRDTFGYKENHYRIIPCTLNRKTKFEAISEEAIRTVRERLNYSDKDCVVVYSGSVAGWQSLTEFGNRILPLMQRDEQIHLLVLVHQIPDDFSPLKYFPNRTQQKWLNAEKVGEVLLAADYGWLVREDTVTNQVASPVKFAEYLAAGLQVIISDRIGDYSDFIKKNNCGIVISQDALPQLQKVSIAQKKECQQLARNHFLKKNYLEAYSYLFQ